MQAPGGDTHSSVGISLTMLRRCILFIHPEVDPPYELREQTVGRPRICQITTTDALLILDYSLGLTGAAQKLALSL